MGWQEDGGPALAEVKRDGSVQLPAAAAPGVRHLQELRGPLPRCLHGWQRCGHAWQGDLVRAQGRGWRRRRQEEVSAECCTCRLVDNSSQSTLYSLESWKLPVV